MPREHPTSPSSELRVPAERDLDLVELHNRSGLRVVFTRDGGLFAVRHDGSLINQVLPSPGDAGLFRLLLREHGVAGGGGRGVPLVGPAALFQPADTPGRVTWRARTGSGLRCDTTFRLHPDRPVWAWQVRLHHRGTAPAQCDLVVAHDLGLADEGAVRNNEAYTSHYIDLLPIEDPALGWVVLARQNQPAAGGRHPWLALACADGASAFATDGWQFFGTDHRLTGVAAAETAAHLPSRRLQYECAMAALQSQLVALAPGERLTITFVGCFEPDHPGASSPDDVERLRADLSGASFGAGAAELPAAEGDAPVPPGRPLFATTPWLHGDEPGPEDWQRWFPGPRRHDQTDTDGRLLSFFHGVQTHVVARAKEAMVARPHGHILRSGDASWIDDAQFGITCYAAGVFAAQAYLGNPSFARLLPVVRDALGATRASGQRVFVRWKGSWRQLGIPSAFAMTPGDVRWIYRFDDQVLEARAWCSPVSSAGFLELRVASGAPVEFLVSHELVLGAAEYEHGGTVALHVEGGWAAGTPDPQSLVGRHEPGVRFAIAAAEASTLDRLGGDELLHEDGARRSGAYVVIAFRPVTRCGVVMLGVRDGDAALPGAVLAARREFAESGRAAHPPALTLGLRHDAEPGVARLDDILPWFNHNAAIHFSAPHGLEQYGGAAWGVRDVTQGSLEWLLTQGRHGTIRRVLEVVFGQQYAHDGTWPQWFMHDPYRFIQQAHSHGDVCFWPVKALCDYVEAADDPGFMQQAVGYTDAGRCCATGPEESYWEHCDKVVAHAESRFVAGTALVNYGDGDWDDTLQPADPAMRTRMVSAWTVALAYQTFRQLAEIATRAGEDRRARHLRDLLTRIERDVRAWLMPGGIIAGFVVTEGAERRPLLHPQDRVTRIRYRLLPMTRSIIAGLFTPEEARRHLEIIRRELRYPDGVRLMSEPAAYRGGLEQWFKRADTAANVGREIGLQYVHAHIRYAEALARVGEAEELWHALQVVNPVALSAVVPNAAPRQSNVYFSSSDADFPDRYEASARWGELRDGRVLARGGWRLYSSGPGLYLHKVRGCLLGIRESFGEIVFDPVLPGALDGLGATVLLCGRRADLRFRVRSGTAGAEAVVVNGQRLDGVREFNPYRRGGLRVPVARLAPLLGSSDNLVEVEL